jgi:hypothetical protein
MLGLEDTHTDTDSDSESDGSTIQDGKSNNLTTIEINPSDMESIGRHEYYDHQKQRFFRPAKSTKDPATSRERRLRSSQHTHTHQRFATYAPRNLKYPRVVFGM